MLTEFGTAALLPFKPFRTFVYIMGSAFHFGMLFIGKVGLLFNLYIPALYLFFADIGPKLGATVKYTRSQLAMRLLRRADVLEAFQWQETSAEFPRLVVSLNGKDYRGAKAACVLCQHLIIINPLFVFFAGVYLALLFPWVRHVLSRFRHTVVPMFSL